MVKEKKINALLQRKKPRDFFDLYFILRKGISRKTVASHKNRLMDEENLKKEPEKIDEN